MKAFVSWSGGKETSLACYRTMQKKEVEVVCLLNMISEDGIHSRSHGINSDLLRLQAEAIGIPIIQRRTSWENYENEFKKAISDLKKKDIQAGVFGDIDLQEHRDWVERVCKDIGIKPILPLWKEEREKLLETFIEIGFRAIVVATNANFLGEEWLGREINGEFIEELKELGNIDPVRNNPAERDALPLVGISNEVDLCGERGEYHTFVYDGPIFKKSVEFVIEEKMLKDKRWFLHLKLRNE